MLPKDASTFPKVMPQLMRGGLHFGFVIRHQSETPFDQGGFVSIGQFPLVQKGDDLLLQVVLLAGIVEDLEDLH